MPVGEGALLWRVLSLTQSSFTPRTELTYEKGKFMRNNFRPLVWLGRYSLAAGLALGMGTSAMAQDEAPAATAEAPAAEEAKGEEE